MHLFSAKWVRLHLCWRVFLLAGLAGAVLVFAIALQGSGTRSGGRETPVLDNTVAATPDLDIRSLRAMSFGSTPLTRREYLGDDREGRLSVIGYRSEGRMLFGLQALPETPEPAGGYPTVILCHGYVNPWDYQTTGPEYREDIRALTRHGYAVIKPDYRGQGLSPGAPEGAYFSDGYVVDTLSLIEAIKHTSYLNEQRLAIMGHSMGGYVALKTAVVSPDIKATVLLAGAVGSPRELLEWNPVSMLNNPVAVAMRDRVVQLHGTPDQSPEFWASASPLNFLRNLNGPVQIHVGTGDQQVPPSFSWQLQQKLAAAGATSSYYEYPNGGHGLGSQRELIWPRVLALLDDHLGGPMPSLWPDPIPMPAGARR